MSTLPVLRVKTLHSEYIIDQNAGKFSRRTVHDKANPIHGFSDGDLRSYDKIVNLEVGESMRVIFGDAWIRSTPIESIEEVPSE